MDSLLSRNRFGAVKQRFLDEKEEYVKIILLFAYLFCVASASTVGRTAADTLFLTHFSASKLSLMYLPQAAILLLAGLVYQKLCKRIRIDLLCTIVTIGVGVLSLGSRLVAGLGLNWIYAVMYVAFDMFNFLMIVCFWQFATSVMDQRKAKKLINWVGSGSIVGGIVSGFGLKLLVQPIGTLNLIIVYAGLQLLCFVFVRMIIRKVADKKATFDVVSGNRKKQAAGEKRRSRNPGESGGIFRHVPHLKYIALIAATITLSLTFADYQFKIILRDTLQDEALAGFMGSFYGYAGILALGVQFFVTGRVISNFGVMTSLLVLPVALLTGSIGVLIAPILALSVLVKGSDKVLGDTIYSSVSQLIMFPIPPDYRARAKSWLDGTVKNGAKGLAAISLIILSPILSIQQFSIIIVVLLICCIFGALRIKKAYMQLLMSTLQTRGDVLDAEWDIMDAASLKALVEALQSPDPLQALYALRILQSIKAYDLTPHIPQLLRHASMEVRVEGLKVVQRLVPKDGEEELERFLLSAQPLEKSHAILALAAYGHEAQLERISSYLVDEHVQAKSAAIAGLISHYGVEGMFQAVGTIKQLIDSEEEEDRVAVASLFGQIGVSSFYKPIIPLLSDPSHQVRTRALESAALLRVPALVPHIVPLLGSSSTRQLAIEALAGYEDQVIVPLIEPYLLSEGAISQHVPKVYERIGTQWTFDRMLRNYALIQGDNRTSMLDSMMRMNERGRYAASAAVEKLIVEEADLYGHLIDYTRGFEAAMEVANVAEAVTRLQKQTALRIFGLLSFMYDSKTIKAVYTNWANGDARRQANAAEVIDQLVHGEMRSVITRVMAMTGSARAAKPPDAEVMVTRMLALRLLPHGDRWLDCCITDALSKLPAASNKWRDVEGQDSKQHPSDVGQQMEQVRLLHQVTLFKGLSGKDLSVIAQHLREVNKAAGEVIIREGEEGDSLYLIRQGRANVIRREAVIGKLQDGDCFGEMAVLTSGLRTATVIADEPCSLWRLDTAVFYEMMFNQSEIALEMMRLLSQRLRGAIDRKVHDRPETAIPAMNEAAATSNDNVAVDTRPSPRSTGAEEVVRTDSSLSTDNQTILRRILVLQKIRLFANFSQDDFVRLARMVEEVHYEPGERIYSAGEEGGMMHGIIEGRVRVHHGTETLALLGEGEYIGEMSIIDNELRSADCTAEERLVLLQLTREQVLSFCFQHIEVMKGMMGVLAERLKRTQEQG